MFFAADESSNYGAKQVHLDNLYRMVAYCENCIECRRAQQLQYFGERFRKDQCKENPRAVCDNCSSKVSSKAGNLLSSAFFIAAPEKVHIV